MSICPAQVAALAPVSYSTRSATSRKVPPMAKNTARAVAGAKDNKTANKDLPSKEAAIWRDVLVRSAHDIAGTRKATPSPVHLRASLDGACAHASLPSLPERARASDPPPCGRRSHQVALTRAAWLAAILRRVQIQKGPEGAESDSQESTRARAYVPHGPPARRRSLAHAPAR